MKPPSLPRSVISTYVSIGVCAVIRKGGAFSDDFLES